MGRLWSDLGTIKIWWNTTRWPLNIIISVFLLTILVIKSHMVPAIMGRNRFNNNHQCITWLVFTNLLLASNIMACTGWMALRGTPPHVRVCSGIVQYKFDRNTVQFGKWNEVTGLKLANGAFIILSKSCFQSFHRIVQAIIWSKNSLNGS